MPPRGQDRLRLDDRHLGVVGELARLPQLIADHLAYAAEHRPREPLRVLTRLPEFERRAECVADCRADDRAERAMAKHGRLQVQAFL